MHVKLVGNSYTIENSQTIIPLELIADFSMIRDIDVKKEIKAIIQEELTFQKFKQETIDEILLEFESLL